jgi:Family of unknown function (DUF6311)
MNSQKRFINLFLPALLGVMAFFWVVGIEVLNPQYLGWLMGRFDPIQHYLGWDFFRRSEWTNPIGLSPTFGLDISSSIVYADSIPLMAIIFKVFDQVLPVNFQYFGIWLLICFLLQAYFGWKLASICVDSYIKRALMTILFIVSPQMLWRLNTHAGVHNALVSHFLILAGIFLSLRKDIANRFFYWIILFVASLTINFYFLLITSMLWMADSVDRYLAKEYSAKRFIKELLILLAIVILLGWQVGYFAIATSSVDIWGYGFFRFNLMAPFDSYGLSPFLPKMKLPSTWGEGYGYFGAGVLVGAIFAVPYFAIKWRDVRNFIFRYLALIMTLLLFFLLSITNNIGAGMTNYVIDLPEIVLKVLGITHSAARFFWPIYYFLLVFLAIAIQKIYSKKVSLLILCFVVLLQLVDLYPLRQSIKVEYAKDMTGIYDGSLLKSQLWLDIAKKYKKLILIPSLNQPPYWETLAFFASKHGLSTNSIFTARIDSAKVDASNKKIKSSIAQGLLSDDAFYIVHDSFVLPILSKANIDSLMFKLDGMNVFLPNWRKCVDCLLPDENLLITFDKLTPILQKKIMFSSENKNANYYLGEGWSWLESWGVWSDSASSTINLPIPNNKKINGIKLRVKPFVVAAKKEEQVIEIFLNEIPITHQKIVFDESTISTITIPLDAKLNLGNLLSIKIILEQPMSPRSLGIGNNDDRKLGVGLISASFY